ncbi:hypothetical protein [Sphingobacterium pedocola]|uniref:hypothetical protein n=1 Tax=Sphingobacterium pedocola TaxID=2082722 RepID=UPI0018CB853B|nr:hypothetical protein [Sphingobacterium pedocola]
MSPWRVANSRNGDPFWRAGTATTFASFGRKEESLATASGGKTVKWEILKLYKK